MELGNIGMGPVHPSICPSCLRAFLHDGWMDFLHIGYHDQVPWAADACKTEFGSVPTLTNYGHFFINFLSVCYDMLEKSVMQFFHLVQLFTTLGT